MAIIGRLSWKPAISIIDWFTQGSAVICIGTTIMMYMNIGYINTHVH